MKHSEYKTLQLGSTVELYGNTYDVMSVQYDYDFTVRDSEDRPLSFVWAVELRIVVSDSVDRTMLNMPYLYLKYDDNDPSLRYINAMTLLSDDNYIEDIIDWSQVESEVASINIYAEEPTLTIKHSNKLPVTMINPSSGNDRVVRYCVVKTYKRNPLMGRITIKGKAHKVTRRILSNGDYSQWELL